jgi:hydroxyacylglutathione hydrolase
MTQQIMSTTSKLISQIGTTRLYTHYKHFETFLTRRFSNTMNMNTQQTHSQTCIYDFGDFLIKPLAIFSDNYAYLIYDIHSQETALVDPADATEIKRVILQDDTLASEISTYLSSSSSSSSSSSTPSSTSDNQTTIQQHPFQIRKILATHKHSDHSGGNCELAQAIPSLEIIGGKHDNVAACTKSVDQSDTFKIGQNINVNVLHLPCHTRGHVAYVLTSQNSTTDRKTPTDESKFSNRQFTSALFSGDTLFIAGVGKFFEGSAAEMYHNLKQLSNLDDKTSVFPGHEYTEGNLEFAHWVEPDNEDIRKKLEWAQKQRQNGQSTLATTIGEEKLINPFIRAILPTSYNSVVRRLATAMKDKNLSESEQPSEEAMIQLLAAVREAKNSNLHKK